MMPRSSGAPRNAIAVPLAIATPTQNDTPAMTTMRATLAGGMPAVP
jgi:hypothetical protein